MTHNSQLTTHNSQLTGFTLIELLVVLIIIGILATLGMPKYNKVVERSRQAEALTMLGALRGAQLRYAAENNGSYTPVITNLDLDSAATGKYFNYTVTGASDANLAQATRNAVQQTSGISGYVLKIRRDGTISCVTMGANDCVDIPYIP